MLNRILHRIAKLEEKLETLKILLEKESKENIEVVIEDSEENKGE